MISVGANKCSLVPYSTPMHAILPFPVWLRAPLTSVHAWREIPTAASGHSTHSAQSNSSSAIWWIGATRSLSRRL